MRRPLLVLALAAGLAIVGCAGKKPVVPPEQLWEEANTAFTDEAYEYSVDRYKQLLDQHPFDPRAEEAELKIAHAYYLSHRYPEAIAAFGDFERMHPTSPNLAMVEYYRGMSYLEQHKSADRDQTAVANANTSFQSVVERFPGTPFAEKARLRVRECREILAMHEADIARFYLQRDSIRAAESRLRGLLLQYPDTDATAAVLENFAAFYTKRDEDDGAALALATIAVHHPDDPLAVSARAAARRQRVPHRHEPLPLLLGRIDQMRTAPDRTNVPATVSAYPDTGNASGARY